MISRNRFIHVVASVFSRVTTTTVKVPQPHLEKEKMMSGKSYLSSEETIVHAVVVKSFLQPTLTTITTTTTETAVVATTTIPDDLIALRREARIKVEN